MESVVNLLRKVPAALRFLVLVVIAVIGFVLFFIGWDEAITWLSFLGAAIFIFDGYIFYYLIKSKAQL